MKTFSTGLESPIKVLREKVELDQRDFGRLLGLSQAAVCSIEYLAMDLSPTIVNRLIEIGLDGNAIHTEHKKLMAKGLVMIEEYAREQLGK